MYEEVFRNVQSIIYAMLALKTVYFFGVTCLVGDTIFFDTVAFVWR